MKKCTTCGNEAPADATVCPLDQQPLADMPAPASNQTDPATSDRSAKRRLPVCGALSIITAPASWLLFWIITVAKIDPTGEYSSFVVVSDLFVLASPLLGFGFSVTGLLRRERYLLLSIAGLVVNFAQIVWVVHFLKNFSIV